MPDEPQDDSGAVPAQADDSDATDGAGRPTGTKPVKKRRTPLWLETAVLLVVALLMALVIKSFFVQAFYIPSASMEPGLIKNDRILVQKVSYWFGGEPQRGDVIVFKDPGNWLTGSEKAEPTSVLSKGLEKIGLYPSGGHLVKRVIGLPGDKIVCCDAAGQLQINGVSVPEDDFIRPQKNCDGPMVNDCSKNWTVARVPDNMLFVMGDNRAESGDSSARLCDPTKPSCDYDRAFVPEDDVVGKVFALVWPIKRFTLVSRPDVFSSVPNPS